MKGTFSGERVSRDEFPGKEGDNMRRENKRASTKRLLLEATRELIREKGCSGTTLADIMERSGLSKGAIFHYVKSKNELFYWVLQERSEDIDARFQAAAERPERSFEGPMQEILARLPELTNPQELSNQVLMYLLGKSDVPDVREALARHYEQALRQARRWIEAGQDAGVIPPSVNPAYTAELFMLISFGLRMRGAAGGEPAAFGVDEFAKLMTASLQPER